MTVRTKSAIFLCVLFIVCGYFVLGVLRIPVAVAPFGPAESADRSTAPSLGPAPRLDLPPVQKRTLSNGLPVWVIEAHEVPLVQMNLVVRAGSGDDPPGKFGVASLTAAMLDEGAGSRSALEIADAIEFLGASLNTTSSFDASSVRLNAPLARVQDALPLMADVALRPTFPEPDLDRLRQERITTLLQAREEPESIASMAFMRLVFGPGHRYGTGQIGREPTLRMLTSQDLRALHATYYQPSNAALIVVGDVTAEAMLPQLEPHFGVWKNTSAVTRVPLTVAPQIARGQIYIVDKPDAEQSQIRLGWVGVPRDTPDYFTLQVLNTVLGGSFTSRLNQNLRETHGYTYGAGSVFDMRLSAGPFFAYAGVQTDKTADALREFFHELNRIKTPIDPDELKKAKNYMALSFPGEFETTADLSGRLEELIVYGLPEQYFEQYVGKVEAVSAADVRRAAETYIEPARFAVVVVGDRRAIEPGIRMLNLGPVRVLSVEEALGP